LLAVKLQYKMPMGVTIQHMLIYYKSALLPTGKIQINTTEHSTDNITVDYTMHYDAGMKICSAVVRTDKFSVYYYILQLKLL